MSPASADKEPALAATAELQSVMARLRAECPWTREQTHESLRQYLIEEAWETVDAIDSSDADLLVGELGDLLMQVVFHAAIAESESEGWSFTDVARRITEKLVRRSPHVFGDAIARTPEDVDALWRERKGAEGGGSDSDRDGNWAALPALIYAQKVLARTDWQPQGDDIGAKLARLVAEAEAAGVDAESALRDAVRNRPSAAGD